MTPCLSFFFIILSVTDCEICILVISEPLGLFVKTFTADDKYSLRNSENMKQPI